MGNSGLSLIWLFTFVLCFNQSTHQSSNNLNSHIASDCQRCKVLIDSFNKGLERTSRNKYDGGDTAWEEAKLKSYARSEVRLVEIQERLCSEVKKDQDHCYVLAEEAEQLLEQWWFIENQNKLDLYIWLCIDQLKYCCPINHYGESCTPCPTDNNNKVCGGRGKCDGERTRNGNGTCICNKGYSGVLCEECAFNFYHTLNICKPCHRACNGCSNLGPASCLSCNPGWRIISGVCIDINECINPSTCDASEYCLNYEGTYVCKACDRSCQKCIGPGSSNCTLCDSNRVLWSGYCVDDDQKVEAITIVYKQLSLYFGFLLITLFLFRHSKMLASFVVLVIAMYIFIAEKTAKFSSFEVFLNEFYYK